MPGARTVFNLCFLPLPPLHQVVIIAAGFDTRAYRLSRPGVKFFEIDLPSASQKKIELVKELLPSSEVSTSLTGILMPVRCCLLCRQQHHHQH